MGAKRGGSLKPVSSPDPHTSGQLGSLYPYRLLHTCVHITLRCAVAYLSAWHVIACGEGAG